MQWICKRPKPKDIRITTYSSNKDIRIAFYHDLSHTLSKTGFIDVAFDNDPDDERIWRLYFREGNSESGYRITHPNVSTYGNISISRNKLPIASNKFVDCFELEFDVENNLNYITNERMVSR